MITSIIEYSNINSGDEKAREDDKSGGKNG